MKKSDMALRDNVGDIPQELTLCTHAFYDLTHVSPLVFAYLLKECYFYGTCKATSKFRALQHQVHQVLFHCPQPGPITFVIHCLYVLPIFSLHCEGFSHLILSSVRRFLKQVTVSEDTVEVKRLATRLFIDIILGSLDHHERIVIKIIENFDVRLTDIEESITQLKAQIRFQFDTAQELVEQYIFKLVESQSYVVAATLLEHFSIRQFGQSLLWKILQNNQSETAEKWARYMGKPLLCILVQEYLDRDMLMHAYEMIKRNNLKKEFSDIQLKRKNSSIMRLAGKALWDLAEKNTQGDRKLIGLLVCMAMEAGYPEKVVELCDRYSFEHFLKEKARESASSFRSRFLCLKDLTMEEIVWVDEVNGLQLATSHIEECDVVGVDCEWKPNYVKGCTSRVSIMQIASDKMVFIFDMIKLFEDVPSILDNCLTRIFNSHRILKLGYGFSSDICLLTRSYGNLNCFKNYEMLLDLHQVFKEVHGGLAGLTKRMLGVSLNKARQNCDWEERPLSPDKLEYAALDAAVLVHIFKCIRDSFQAGDLSDNVGKLELKSYPDTTERTNDGSEGEATCHEAEQAID